MHYLYIATALALLASAAVNRAKTYRALQIAARRMAKILVPFLSMLALVSIVLFLTPERALAAHLSGTNRFMAMALAMALGSVSLMPGFIAFPLSGLLLQQGVPFFVLSAFTTTLMMVGLVTLPLERHYLGTRTAIIRNGIGLVVAVVVALATGLCYGELW